MLFTHSLHAEVQRQYTRGKADTTHTTTHSQRNPLIYKRVSTKYRDASYSMAGNFPERVGVISTLVFVTALVSS